MSWPRLAFVSGPSVDAEVRLELNLHGFRPPAFSLGTVQLVGDPDSIAPELDLREVTLTFFADEESHSRAWAAAMGSVLARELMRPRNWLLIQLSEDVPPVWAHTYASPDADLSFEFIRPEVDSLWSFDLTLIADPGLFGPVEAFEVTIPNNPATGGCRTALSSVKGDLPAPLNVTVPTATGLQPAIAVGSADTAPVFHVLHGEAASVVSGIDQTGAHPSASNGSARLMTAPCLVEFSFSPGVPGRWAVFARAQIPGGGGGHVTYQFHNGRVDFPAARFDESTGSNAWVWLTLGDVSAPRGAVPELDAVTISGAAPLQLFVSDGSALIIDCLALVPIVDGSVLTRRGSSSAALHVYDADGENALDMASAGVMTMGEPPSLVGGFPVVKPGKQHVLSFLRYCFHPSLGFVAMADNKDSSTTLQVSYHPRHLFLPGG